MESYPFKLDLCFFVAGGQSLVALFVFGLVLCNVGVFVDAVLDLPRDKVDFKSQVIPLTVVTGHFALPPGVRMPSLACRTVFRKVIVAGL